MKNQNEQQDELKRLRAANSELVSIFANKNGDDNYHALMHFAVIDDDGVGLCVDIISQNDAISGTEPIALKLFLSNDEGERLAREILATINGARKEAQGA